MGNIGYMTSFLYLSNRKVQLEEKEEPGEGEEGEEGEEKEAAAEEPKEEEVEGEEGKIKFKPEGFSWTNYDGIPRNHVQVVSRFTKYPIKECDTTIRDLEGSLIEILNNDIKTKEGKINLINY